MNLGFWPSELNLGILESMSMMGLWLYEELGLGVKRVLCMKFWSVQAFQQLGICAGERYYSHAFWVCRINSFIFYL